MWVAVEGVGGEGAGALLRAFVGVFVVFVAFAG